MCAAIGWRWPPSWQEVILAGGNALGVRYTVLELDALWGAALRFALAGAMLAGATVALRLRLPRGAALRSAALYGLLNFAGAYAAAYYALSHMRAGLASTLIAAVPLVTLLLAVTQRREPLRVAALAGGALALTGVALVSRAPLAEAVPPVALVAAVAGILCMGQAAIVARGLQQTHDTNPVVLNTVGMTVAAVVLLVAAVVAGDRIVLPERATTWFAIGYVVVGGSIGVFMLYLVVLQHWEASRAAYLTLLVPPVAVVLSAWLDDEPITGGLLLGGGLIVAGVWIGAVRPSTRSFSSAGGAGRIRALPGRVARRGDHTNRRSTAPHTPHP